MKLENKKLHRVIAIMDRDEIDYLDKIGKDSLFTSGTKLSRIKILRAMVDAMKELKIDGKNIRNETGLKNEILKKVSSYIKDALILILTLGLLTMPVTPAWCKPNSISRSLVMTIRVVPRTDLQVNREAIEKEVMTLDSAKLAERLFSNEKDTMVNRIYRNGMETILVTKVSE